MTPFPEVDLKKFKRKHIAHYFFPVGYFLFQTTLFFSALHIHKSCKPQPTCFATYTRAGKATMSHESYQNEAKIIRGKECFQKS